MLGRYYALVQANQLPKLDLQWSGGISIVKISPYPQKTKSF